MSEYWDDFQDNYKNDDGSWNFGKVANTAGMLASLTGITNIGNSTRPQTGYQGGIDNLVRQRQRVEGTNDPSRRPGGAGQRYFTKSRYVAAPETAETLPSLAEEAAGLKAANAANVAKQVTIPVVDEPATQSGTSEFGINAQGGITQLVDNSNLSSTDADYTITPRPELYTNPSLEKDRPNFDPNSAPPTVATPDPFFNTSDPITTTSSVVDEAAYAHLDRPGVDGIRNDMEDSIAGNIENELQNRENADRNASYAAGGLAGLKTEARGNRQPQPSRYLNGSTDGMADKIPASIDGMQEARLSDGEFVIPADVVSHLGNGNSNAGAKILENMMGRIRKQRTGTTEQAKQIEPKKFLPVRS